MHRSLLVLPLLAACTPEPVPVALELHAHTGTAPATCGADVTLGTPATTGQLADARMFVSHVQMRDADGSWVDVELDESAWQHDSVVLLDWEDGTGACADSGTADTNDTIRGTLPAGDYDAVRFDVGVPHSQNHVDATLAPAPLNVPGMFWTWQGGFKFVRVDFVSEAGRFNVHVGSTMCDGATAVDPSTSCDRSNRASIVVEGLAGPEDAVHLDLAQLVAGVDITLNTPDSPPGCMSAPIEPDDCTPVFAALGLDFTTGSCDGECAGQSVFESGEE
ncbi:MAG: metallo-mystery pair system four-Cys motif protein [Myxococcales bacterium]|nr:metallo-mystery pair system four-Cys motif protein [Myxococcales bacterium]MCB9668956.1 metallo-mystery pair system four-Cys motif protein [Alphaproteobacteria bacterium]MCB9691283.1 metallo-mystery pair system four-Cys motif protein [Alphaproteobacteria bacterium]